MQQTVSDSPAKKIKRNTKQGDRVDRVEPKPKATTVRGTTRYTVLVAKCDQKPAPPLYENHVVDAAA